MLHRKNRLKRSSISGYTLVEMLTAISVLVILAGIAMPQVSKMIESGNRAAAIKNIKQLGMSVMMYAADFDHIYPSAYAMDGDDLRMNNGIPAPVAIPTGWVQDGYHNSDDVMKGDSVHWANVIMPYVKQPSFFESPGLEVQNVLKSSVKDSKEAIKCGFTYNGYLHQYPVQQVKNPSKVPIFWNGLGKTCIQGFALTNPYLVSSSAKLNANRKGALLGGDVCKIGSYSYRNNGFNVYGKSVVVVYADGSAGLLNFEKEMLRTSTIATAIESKQSFTHRSDGRNVKLFDPDED